MSTARPAARQITPGLDSEFGVTRESTVSLRVARTLIEVVERAGVPRAELLRAAQFSPDQLMGADARIPRAQVYALCELAIELTRDPALGLHWAEKLNDGSLVPISHLMAHAATLRQAFESLWQFYRLLSDETCHQLLEAGDEASLRVWPVAGESVRIQRFLSEMMVAGFFRFIRSFNVQARLRRVSFTHAAPAYQTEYARIFELPVVFDAPFTELVFDRALLEAPAPHKDADLHEALKTLAERRLLNITERTPYALRVREFLLRSGGPHKVDMDEVARAVGLSARSLRRRLSDEGKPYHDVANEALAIVAQHLLRDKGRTIQEAAYALGFSNASAFHRAFRRWTGTTPIAYRKAQRAEG
jgi:AraC-like DNA-binding protein